MNKGWNTSCGLPLVTDQIAISFSKYCVSTRQYTIQFLEQGITALKRELENCNSVQSFFVELGIEKLQVSLFAKYLDAVRSVQNIYINGIDTSIEILSETQDISRIWSIGE